MVFHARYSETIGTGAELRLQRLHCLAAGLTVHWVHVGANDRCTDDRVNRLRRCCEGYGRNECDERTGERHRHAGSGVHRS